MRVIYTRESSYCFQRARKPYTRIAFDHPHVGPIWS